MREIVDMHCHLLHGCDDGSTSLALSLEMLRAQAEQGVTTVCITPHFYSRQTSVEDFCARRDPRLRELVQAMPDGMPRLVPGVEVAYFPLLCEEPRLMRLCLLGTRTLMLEMPFGEWQDTQVETVQTLSLDLGLDVVLVHPERFCFSSGNRRRLGQLMRLPVGIQVNADSLLHLRGRRLALELLEQAAFPLLASDCHDMAGRPPQLREGRQMVKRSFGAAFLDRMDDTAARLVEPCFGAP